MKTLLLYSPLEVTIFVVVNRKLVRVHLEYISLTVDDCLKYLQTNRTLWSTLTNKFFSFTSNIWLISQKDLLLDKWVSKSTVLHQLKGERAHNNWFLSDNQWKHITHCLITSWSEFNYCSQNHGLDRTKPPLRQVWVKTRSLYAKSVHIQLAT